MNSNYHESNLDSWTQCNVGDICSFEYGKSLTKANRNECGIYPVVGSSGIVGKHDLYLCEGPSIVVGRKGAAGEVTIVKDNFWPIDTTYYVKIPNGISLEYVYYLFKRLRLNQYETSTAIPGLNRNDIYQLRIQIPPLPEQRQIVAKIEELFSELDKSVELLKTLQQQVKVYRQAVLKAAFEGKFTNDNSPWQTISLKDIGVWTGGGTPSKNNNDYWDNGTILWVSPKDMKCKVIDDTMNKITTEGLINSSAKLISKGSILFVVRSGILRRTIPIAIAEEDLTTNQDIQSVTPNGGIQSEYIFWYCKAHEEDIREKCTKDGTTVDSIETSLLKRYPVKVCSFSNQKQIVQEIESRLSVADKCEDTINQAMQQAESLRQSILKKAFEGRLLSESELEQVRQEPDWEPASVLLEKIKANRKASDISKPPAKKSSRKGKKQS